MHCDQLDRLLQTHSALTLEFFRQDARTQDFYASDEEWVAECKRLASLEERLGQLVADLADHRRRHQCDGSPVEPALSESKGTTESSQGLQSWVGDATESRVP
jgi:hypothetical protein